MTTENDRLDLDLFDLESIEFNSIIVLVGKRRSGKSYLLRNIMYNHRHMPLGTCISATESANPFYADFIPKKFIHFRYNPAIVQGALKRQAMLKKKLNKKHNVELKKIVDSRAFLILDDCIYDKTIKRDQTISEIFMNGRHVDLMFIITMQSPLGISPDARGNVDYAFIFKESSLNNRKKIYDNYASCIPSFKLFNRIMDKCTENYECVVIKSITCTNKLQDQVFWYKAPPTGNFRVCDKIFWEKQDEEEEDSSDDEDTTNHEIQMAKTKGDHIKIRKSKKPR
jgi:hypothetical protein